jgi:hypothetical protein
MARLIRVAAGAEPRPLTRQYHRFRGVDFSTDPSQVDITRSPSAINVLSDAGGYPEKRPGWRVLHDMDALASKKPVNGLHFFVKSNGQTVFVAHVKDKLYTWDESTTAPADLGVTVNNAASVSTVHANKLYLLDGSKYWVYDGTSCAEVTGYVPTTVIGRAPAGGGTPLEPINLISVQRKNSFVGDGGVAEVCRLQISVTATANGNVTVTLNGVAVNTAILTTDTVQGVCAKIAASTYTGWTAVALGDTVTFTATAPGAKSDATYSPGSTGALGNMITLTQGADPVLVYQLNATGIDSVDSVVVDGVTKTVTTDYTVDLTNGIVTFVGGHNPPTPANSVDNVIITFSKTVSGNADRIKKCTIMAWYGMGNDSRLFLSGNPDYPNWDWQSGLFDPTYFPETGYTKVGADSSAIMGYLRQYNNQLIIKSDNEQDATIYMRTAELDEAGNPYFPLQQGVAGVGAISKHAFATLRDDPLFLGKEGVFAPTLAYGGVGQQRVTQERSRFVNALLRRESNLQNAVGTVWNGRYLLCVNSHCYVADAFQPRVSGAGYEWYYWTNIPAVCFMQHADSLYFGTADGRICRFSDDLGGAGFNDDGEAIDAMWATKFDDDGDFTRLKNLSFRGSGVLAKPNSKSSLTVYLRTEKDAGMAVRSATFDVFDFSDLDFASLDFDTLGAPDLVPINHPAKGYRTLQIIVRNNQVNQGLGIFGITKRFQVGGYAR